MVHSDLRPVVITTRSSGRSGDLRPNRWARAAAPAPKRAILSQHRGVGRGHDAMGSVGIHLAWIWWVIEVIEANYGKLKW